MEVCSNKLESEQRHALIEHISQHLADLDDQTLLTLADLAREANLNVDTVGAAGSFLTRRRFLTAALTGGLLAASAGAVAVWQYGSGRGQELNNENVRLWGLIHLYEQMDEAGLDTAAAAGLAAVGAALQAVAGAAGLVNSGAQSVQDALKRLDLGFPAIRAGIAWLEGWVSDLAQRIHLLEDAIGRALNEVNPITLALGLFFTSIINAIPLGGGQKIREVLDRIGEIVNSIPQAIDGINVKILTPLRDEWFSDQSSKGLKGWLVEPIVAGLLEPLKTMTERWGELLHSWETDLAAPVKSASSRREAIRKQIADYKSRYRMQEPQIERTRQ